MYNKLYIQYRRELMLPPESSIMSFSKKKNFRPENKTLVFTFFLFVLCIIFGIFLQKGLNFFCPLL